MSYSLPYEVEMLDNDGCPVKIRNNGDFRVVLDVIEALNDNELEEQQKIQCALFIFYGEETLSNISDFEKAAKLMLAFINGGEEETEQSDKPPVMNWKHDFAIIAPPVNRVLGYDVRTPGKFCHWYTFLGAYQEVGECLFATVVSIRSKRAKGKKLDKWEEEFYRENRKTVDLPLNLTSDEKDFLSSDW